MEKNKKVMRYQVERWVMRYQVERWVMSSHTVGGTIVT